MSAYEEAAKNFESVFPVFKQQVKNGGFSKRSIERVFIAAIEFPLQDGDLKLSKEELNLLGIVNNLMDAKWTILVETLKEKSKPKGENIDG